MPGADIRKIKEAERQMRLGKVPHVTYPWDPKKKRAIGKISSWYYPKGKAPIKKQPAKPGEKPLIGGRAGTAIRKATGLESLVQALSEQEKKKGK